MVEKSNRKSNAILKNQSYGCLRDFYTEWSAFNLLYGKIRIYSVENQNTRKYLGINLFKHKIQALIFEK
jgi:hypothetical protein